MSSDSSVRMLRPEDAAALVALRREALESHPLAFAASVEDDRSLSIEFVRGSLADTAEAVVFGWFSEPVLAGMVGVARMAKLKSRHKAMVWGMYVSASFRGKGAGSSLLSAAIEHARQWPGVVQIHLGVTESGDDARRLYQRAGFREWGREPRALHWQGRFFDERHMVLHLDKTVGPQGVDYRKGP